MPCLGQWVGGSACELCLDLANRSFGLSLAQLNFPCWVRLVVRSQQIGVIGVELCSTFHVWSVQFEHCCACCQFACRISQVFGSIKFRAALELDCHIGFVQFRLGNQVQSQFC